jgi:hypothetical protein
MQQTPEPQDHTVVDVIEAPDGVLNVVIRTGRSAADELDDLSDLPRRAPKRVPWCRERLQSTAESPCG